ncbi:MAG: MFS transporter [Polyangia bacterium]
MVYPGAVTRSSSTSPRRFRTGPVLLLSGAHFVHDIYTAFLAPLLPLLIDKLQLTLLQAGSLTLFLRVPSVLNPLVGSLIDRGGFARALVIVSPGITGLLLSGIGLAPSYGALAAILLCAGLSNAALHVSTPVLIFEVAGARIGRGMSFYMVGGELARTVGPLAAVQAVSFFTLEGLWKAAPVAIAASLVLWWRLGGLQRERTSTSEPSHLLAVWRRMGRTIIGLVGIMVSRSFMAAATVTFLPTFVYGEGETLLMANISLSVLELAGAVGALTAGTVSDWAGRRWVLFVAVACAPPLMLLFLAVDGLWRLPVLVGLGLAALSTTPVLMAVMIENAGSDRAAANGTFMMISFAVRSVVVLAVGGLGDAIGLRDTYALCALIAALGLPFVLLMPRRRGGGFDG